MKSKITYKTDSLIFRQWSRKNYAIFASLGKEINIGHVDVEISEKSITKCSKKNCNILDQLEFANDKEGNEEFLEDLANQQILASLLVISNSDDSSRQLYCFVKNQTSKHQNISSYNLGCNNQYLKNQGYDQEIIRKYN